MTFWTVTSGEGIARMVFSDPAGRNRLSTAMFEQAREVLDALVAEGIRAVVVTAVPISGVWSAGHDIGEIPTEKSERVWANPLENFLEYFRRVPIAIIAEVDGDVWGGAFELMLSADLIVARDGVRFAVTPARLGVGYPSSGIARFLAAMPVHLVNELLFTADPITARRCHELGLVNRLVAAEDSIEATSIELARHIARNAPLTIAAVKAATAELTDSQLPAGPHSRAEAAVSRAWLSDDLTEGLAAFRERRRAEFHGR